jgi:hypothetical protein
MSIFVRSCPGPSRGAGRDPAPLRPRTLASSTATDANPRRCPRRSGNWPRPGRPTQSHPPPSTWGEDAARRSAVTRPTGNHRRPRQTGLFGIEHPDRTARTPTGGRASPRTGDAEGRGSASHVAPSALVRAFPVDHVNDGCGEDAREGVMPRPFAPAPPLLAKGCIGSDYFPVCTLAEREHRQIAAR